MANLLTLADQVENNEDVAYYVFKAFGDEGTDEINLNCYSALQGSLDAAYGLHCELLPQWKVKTIEDLNLKDLKWFVVLVNKNTGKWVQSKAKTPAAAWVAAICRARHYTEDNND